MIPIVNQGEHIRSINIWVNAGRRLYISSYISSLSSVGQLFVYAIISFCSHRMKCESINTV